MHTMSSNASESFSGELCYILQIGDANYGLKFK